MVSDRTLVLINGRVMNNAVIGSVDWSRLPVLLEDVERIEVVRGPGSAASAHSHSGEKLSRADALAAQAAGIDRDAVAERIEADASLSETRRHEAINLVLERCSSIRERARSLPPYTEEDQE